jgi:hypothetical protein
MSFYWGIVFIDVKRNQRKVIVASCHFCCLSWGSILVAVFFLVCRMITFLVVLGHDFRPCIASFLLLSFEGLDSWKDIV